jgi:hypothetical protein
MAELTKAFAVKRYFFNPTAFIRSVWLLLIRHLSKHGRGRFVVACIHLLTRVAGGTRRCICRRFREVFNDAVQKLITLRHINPWVDQRTQDIANVDHEVIGNLPVENLKSNQL